MEDQVNFCEEGNVEKLLNSEENLTISSNERESLKEEFSQEWLDVLGSGSLMLKTLKEGEGDKPIREESVTINIEIFLKNDNKLVEKSNRLEFVLGDGDVIRAIELSVPLMSVGAECEVIANSKLGYKEFGLDPNIPPNSDLKLKIKLLSNKGKIDYEKLSVKDKTTICDNKREKGNSLYSRGDYSDAIQCYTKALTILDTSGTSINDSQEDLQSSVDVKVKCYSNLAAAQLKVGAHDAAEQSCSLALAVQPNNVKALFRKAKAIMNKGGDLDQAAELMKKAIKIDPSERAIHSELSKLLSRISKQNKSQKEIYQRMFGASNNSSDLEIPTRKVMHRSLWIAGTALATVIISIFAYMFLQ